MATPRVRTQRRDIQGLRALAVAAVVVFHLWPRALPGGFVGVDVFFVISGYLITAHLVAEVERTGTVSLTRFWARRIRRLLPASLLVLAATLAASVILLPESLLQQAFTEIAASALYVQNWVLAGSSVDYLSADNAPSVVQHFWSLSVEEQFYLVWPLLIVGAVLLAARLRRDDLTPRRAIGTVLAVVFAASLVFSVVETSRSEASAYFVTPTRAWEFAAGGLIVFTPRLLRAGARFTPAASLALSWAGIALIGASFLLIDGDSAFPGWLALLPVVGTALLIYTPDSESQWSPEYVAAFQPVQFLGSISYSVYLWHWPLIVLYPYARGSELSLNGSVVVVAASVVLAWLTKVFVEDPFRTRPWFSTRRPAYVLAAAGMAVVVVASTTGTAWVDGLYAQAKSVKAPFESSAELASAIDASLTQSEWSIADQLAGEEAQAHEWIVDDCLSVDAGNTKRCTYGDADAEKSVVVLGDSIGTTYLPAIRGALEPEGYKVMPLTWGQCPAADVAVTEWGTTKEYESCTEHQEWAVGATIDLDPDLVIVANSGASTYARLLDRKSGTDADEEWGAALARYVTRLTDGGQDVVMMSGPVQPNCSPELGTAPDACEPSATPLDEARVAVEKAAAASAHARYLDTRPWFCNDELTVCPTQIGSSLVRADFNHLTDSFSTRLSLVMRDALLAGE